MLKLQGGKCSYIDLSKTEESCQHKRIIMEPNFRKINISLLLRFKLITAGTAVLREQLVGGDGIQKTCEAFVHLYNISEEKVGASVIADIG